MTDPLTAYVIMRPADRTKRLDGPITTENIASLQPTPEAVQRVTTLCAARGFNVGPFVGISFAITGPAELFSRSFHAVQGGGLELDDADPSVAGLIETVVMDEAAELFATDSVEAIEPEESGATVEQNEAVPSGSDGFYGFGPADSNESPGTDGAEPSVPEVQPESEQEDV